MKKSNFTGFRFRCFISCKRNETEEPLFASEKKNVWKNQVANIYQSNSYYLCLVRKSNFPQKLNIFYEKDKIKEQLEVKVLLLITFMSENFFSAQVVS
jgi:hypothetical protein